jgi:aryl-alcohol dehydrogenase-like predicted oxidoreductase
MEKRTLGKSHLSASVIGLGCWQLGGDFGPDGIENTKDILQAADSNGISFWDTADVYGAGKSEQAIGDWGQKHPKPRVIVSKVGRDGSLYPDGYSADNIIKSIEASLTRLQVDSLDLVQLHCVPPKELQQDTIWNILEDCRSQGLIKHYGASVETIDEGLLCLDKPGLTSLQIIFNLFRQDAIERLLPKAKAADVGIIVRLPLASGLLSGKFERQANFSENDHRNYNRDGKFFNVGETFSGLPYEKGVELVDLLKAMVPDGLTLSQLALRWIIDHPEVTTVIAGASSAKQVVQNSSTASSPSLSKELHKVLGSFYKQEVKQHIRGSI